MLDRRYFKVTFNGGEELFPIVAGTAYQAIGLAIARRTDEMREITQISCSECSVQNYHFLLGRLQ